MRRVRRNERQPRIYWRLRWRRSIRRYREAVAHCVLTLEQVRDLRAQYRD